MSNNILEVINRIPQIDSVELEEHNDFYMLRVSYTPRYGFGMVQKGSAFNVKIDGGYEDYDFITIGDIEATENWKVGDEFTPETEIRLKFPEKTYDMFMDRNKETEIYVFCKESFYNCKELVRLNYKD